MRLKSYKPPTNSNTHFLTIFQPGGKWLKKSSSKRHYYNEKIRAKMGGARSLCCSAPVTARAYGSPERPDLCWADLKRRFIIKRHSAVGQKFLKKSLFAALFFLNNKIVDLADLANFWPIFRHFGAEMAHPYV